MRPLAIILLLLISTALKAQLFVSATPLTPKFGVVGMKKFDNKGIWLGTRFGTNKRGCGIAEGRVSGGITFNVSDNKSILFGTSHIVKCSYSRELQEYNYRHATGVNVGITFSIPTTNRLHGIIITDIINYETALGIGYSFSLSERQKLRQPWLCMKKCR